MSRFTRALPANIYLHYVFDAVVRHGEGITRQAT